MTAAEDLIRAEDLRTDSGKLRDEAALWQAEAEAMARAHAERQADAEDRSAALSRREVAAVVFTSASQVHNLFDYAKAQGVAATLAENINVTQVASIGPVCTAALAQFGIHVSIEASPPKLGPLINALDDALSN